MSGTSPAANAAFLRAQLLALPLQRLPHADGDWRFDTHFTRGLPLAENAGELFPVVVHAVSHDGRVRERAIAVLRERLPRSAADPARLHALGILLVRCNDWVDVVACAAESAIDSLLGVLDAEDWFAMLPLLAFLDRSRRRRLTQLAGRVRSRLRRPDAVPLLCRTIEHADLPLAHAALDTATSDGAFLQECITAALARREDSLRHAAARSFVRTAPHGVLVDRVPDLSADRSPFIRAVALRARYGLGLPDAHNAAQAAVLDRSPLVRTVAREILGRAASRAIALEELAHDGSSAVCALGILATDGEAEDARIAGRRLDDDLPRVRAAAVRVVARLSPDAFAEDLRVALADRSPRVVREACRGLARGPHALVRDDLRARIAATTDATVRRELLRLLIAIDRERALLALLDLSAAGIHEHAVAWLAALLRRGLTTGSLALTPTGMDHVASWLREHGDGLPAWVHDQLMLIAARDPRP